MSVIIKNLTKIYGKQKAVDNISFSLQKGEIVGFLGPNGAGKSTTLKIATCFLPPTFGEVQILGIDAEENPAEVQMKIGYLPENNPLYLDMYLRENLRFTGKAYGLSGKRLSNRIDKMIEMCGLELEQNKKIGQLSKGYRQRVGIAQALLHDPEVLILDEPTTGLDPNQVVEIRSLIKQISAHKTVIFSTHIMQEVQAICDRVIIIDKGKILADDSLEHLTGNNKEFTVKIEFSEKVDSALFRSLEGVKNVREEGLNLVLEMDEDTDIRSQIFNLASEHKLPLIGLNKKENSLEDIFRILTLEKHD